MLADEAAGQDALKWVTDSPWWAIVTFIVLLVLAIYPIYGFLKPKRLRYALRTNNLIRDVTHTKTPGLTMTFNDYEGPLESFSVTRLALWLDAPEGIKSSNVKRPLTIRIVEPARILRATI